MFILHSNYIFTTFTTFYLHNCVIYAQQNKIDLSKSPDKYEHNIAQD